MEIVGKLDAVFLSAAYWKIVSQRLSAKANATAKKTRRQIYVLLMFVQRTSVCLCEYVSVFAQVNNKITSRLPGKLHKKKHGKSAERAAAKGKQHTVHRVFLFWHTWRCPFSPPLPLCSFPVPPSAASAKGKQANVLRLPWLPNKHATWLPRQRLRQLTRHPAASSQYQSQSQTVPPATWQMATATWASCNLQPATISSSLFHIFALGSRPRCFCCEHKEELSSRHS